MDIAPSILAFDIGTAFTHGALLEPVEGVYRLVAHAETPTVGFPAVDLFQSFSRGVAALEDILGRRILDLQGEPGAPSPKVVITTSAAPPLRCALIGLTEDLSLPIGLAACRTGMARVTHQVSLAWGKHAQHQALLEMIEALPEVIVLVGGADTAPIRLFERAAHTLAMLLETLPAPQRPAVIFAGNQEARRPLARILGPITDYRVVDNVQPAPGQETPLELRRELAQIHHQKIANLMGHQALSPWVSTPILPSAQGFRIILQFLSQYEARGTCLVGVDIGANQTLLCSAQEGLFWAHRGDLGAGQGLEGLLESVQEPCLARWLPHPPAAGSVSCLLQNHALRPQTLPTEEEEWGALLAAAREAIRLVRHDLAFGPSPLEKAQEPGLIAVRGGVFNLPRRMEWATLALLDALQPRGISRIVWDWASIWPPLGALAQIAPLAAFQTLVHDALLDLATAVSLEGESREERIAAHCRLVCDSGDIHETDLLWGHLRRFPLQEGAMATLDIRCGRHVRLGTAQPRSRWRLRGGAVGVILDARGRPLTLEEEPRASSRWMRTWLSEISP